MAGRSGNDVYTDVGKNMAVGTELANVQHSSIKQSPEQTADNKN